MPVAYNSHRQCNDIKTAGDARASIVNIGKFSSKTKPHSNLWASAVSRMDGFPPATTNLHQVPFPLSEHPIRAAVLCDRECVARRGAVELL
jgi:hypothetical protein